LGIIYEDFGIMGQLLITYLASLKYLRRQDNTYNLNNEVRSPNSRYIWKAIIITYSECVFVALVIQHTTCMRRITLASVTYLARPNFPSFS